MSGLEDVGKSRKRKRPQVEEPLLEADPGNRRGQVAVRNTLRSASDLHEQVNTLLHHTNTPQRNTTAPAGRAKKSKKNPDNWTKRQRVERNGINFVDWDSSPAAIKEPINIILNCYVPTPAQTEDLAKRAREIRDGIKGEEMSECSLIARIQRYILPSFSSTSVLTNRENANFIGGTEPKSLFAYERPDRWAPITTPRADLVVGYKRKTWTEHELDLVPLSFDTRRLKTVAGVQCAQLVGEFKSSQNGGTTYVCITQAAGASATCSNALAYLYDAVEPRAQAGDAELLAKLKDCIVFGLVIDEFVAHITVTWRVASAASPAAQQTASAAAEKHSKAGHGQAKSGRKTKVPAINGFNFACVTGYMLYCEGQTIELLKAVEGIKQWMEGRFTDITEAMRMIV